MSAWWSQRFWIDHDRGECCFCRWCLTDLLKTIQESIKKAGFEPQLRSQDYTFREIPEGIEEQVINY